MKSSIGQLFYFQGYTLIVMFQTLELNSLSGKLINFMMRPAAYDQILSLDKFLKKLQKVLSKLKSAYCRGIWQPLRENKRLTLYIIPAMAVDMVYRDAKLFLQRNYVILSLFWRFI